MKFKNWKINLLNFNKNSIFKFLKLINFKKIIYIKLTEIIYKNKQTNLKSSFKEKLIKISYIKKSKIEKEVISDDNTIKWIISNNKNSIETVAIPNNKNQFTLCLSSQVGCTLNCNFCYTGKQKFIRNLETYEIVSQILLASKRIKKIFKNKKITNLVFMGMGEPLLNFKNVINSIKIIKNKNKINIHKNKITISTSGIINNLIKIFRYKIPVAISLHFTNEIIRSDIMPINKKYKISKIIEICNKFSKKNKITIEYIMLKNINDSIKNVKELVLLLKNLNCKICLIPFNYFPNSIYKSTEKKNIVKFRNSLIENGIVTTIRKKLGDKINASCGQLKG